MKVHCPFNVLTALSVFAACTAGGATVSQTGTVLTIDVGEGETNTYSTALGSDLTQVVKTGAGTLVIPGANKAFTGAVAIQQGVLEVNDKYALGDKEATIDADTTPVTVSEGAQLHTKLAGLGQFVVHVPRLVEIAGTGPDGQGAIVVTLASGKSNEDNWFKRIRLTGDATIGMLNSIRCGFMGFDLQGHTLTLDGSAGTTMLAGLQLKSAGTLHLKKFTTVQSSLTFPSTGEGQFIVDGNTLYLYSGNHNISWTTVFTNAASLQVNGAYTSSGRNVFKGPVVFADTTSVWSNSGDALYSVKFEGAVYGAGNIFKSGPNMLCELAGDATAYTGALVGYSGMVYAKTPTAFPSISSAYLSGASGSFRLEAGDDAWPETDLLAAVKGIGYTNDNGRVLAWTSTGRDVSFTGDWDATRLYHGGPGTLNVSGQVRDDANTKVRNDGGTLRFTGTQDKPRHIRNLYARVGKTVLEDAGTIYVGSDANVESGTRTSADPFGYWEVGGLASTTNEYERITEPARLVLKGNTRVLTKMPPQSVGNYGSLYVFDTAAQGAILEIDEGVTMTNSIMIGYSYGAEKRKGAVHQFGGDVFNSSINGNDLYCAYQSNSYGFYGMYGGTMASRTYFGFARMQDSVGILEQHGGEIRANQIPIGRGGVAEYYMAGGTFKGLSSGTYSLFLGMQAWSDATATGQAVLTLDGKDPHAFVQNRLYVNARTNAYEGVVNLNAGVLETPAIVFADQYAENRLKNGLSHAYLNFNGGTWKATGNWTDPFGAGNQAMERVTVYEKGAMIDTAGKKIVLTTNTLLAPTGRGLASIALPASMPTGYIGAPEVAITGGGGTGATAHAVYNPSNLTVTAIQVTCPGWDYTSEPTVTIYNPGRTEKLACTATLTAETQVSGGIGKTGAGELRLANTNTVTGTTKVFGGTLTVANASALPLAADLSLAPTGTLACAVDGLAFTPSTLTGLGSVSNASITVGTAWNIPAAQLNANGTLAVDGAVVFGDSVVLSVTGDEAATKHSRTLVTATGGITGKPILDRSTLADDTYWQLVKTGNRLLLAYVRGTTIILR